MTWSRSLYPLVGNTVFFHIRSDNDMTVLTDMSGTRHPIDVTPLTRLRSIEFVIRANRFRFTVVLNRWVTQILSHISSAHLETVVFNLQSYSGEVSSDNISNVLEWHNVDVVLQRLAFSNLRNVHLLSTCSVTDRPLSLSGHVMHLLPQCHTRGIFRVNTQ
jgi:hypothetical protein